ncbi:Glycogen synthase, ADP-glucose transglucosylase, partial [hydrothermal vent metagenome]
MKIVIVSSEAVPFSKTGGLADVASALAKAHSHNGHDVWLFVPFYPQIHAQAKSPLPELQSTGLEIEIELGGKPSRRITGRFLSTQLPGSNVTVMFVDQPEFFDRNGLYLDQHGDFGDNAERFIFFSRIVLEATRQMLIRPDIIHANDWQTGLIPALLKLEYQNVPGFEKTGSLFTIHNMQYQGSFEKMEMEKTGLDWKHFNWKEMESYDRLNLLKTGIVFSDIVTTVSPTYASEITDTMGGCGLHGALTERGTDLVGILNGVDAEIWNPNIDADIPQKFNAGTVSIGKPLCKQALQQEMNLPVKKKTPLFGMISRMADQKGFDIITESIETLLNSVDVQFCFLGTGEEKYQNLLTDLAKKYPHKVATTIGFDEHLAHRIEAGIDIFLMPSRFEPCGLNQMYSLLYGTIPLVRKVGGLADSVVDCTTKTLNNGTATGFHFEEYSSAALLKRMREVIDFYHQ